MTQYNIIKIFIKIMNNTIFWHKASNIQVFKKLWIHHPFTHITRFKALSLWEISKLQSGKKYIIRPSFWDEDTFIFSSAWYYKSIFPLSKEEVIAFCKKWDISVFGWKKWAILQSIIIQEFISGEIYWVFFTRNPKNIFMKGLYKISKNHGDITSWINEWEWKLPFFLEKELEHIWDILERYFKTPQDIEFCIQDGKLYILQTRAITTWNPTIYTFTEIKKLYGEYYFLDHDELWETQDMFSYSVIKEIYPCIYIDGKIFIRRWGFLRLIFKYYSNIKDSNFQSFFYNYRKYLLYKIWYQFLKSIVPQKLDLDILSQVFQSYSYSFLKDMRSNLDIDFKAPKANFMTRQFLSLEKQKQKSFIYLEKYKKTYIWNSFWKNEGIIDIKNPRFIWWTIVNYYEKKDIYIYIFSWDIIWTCISEKTFKKWISWQVLICENLSVHIYEMLPWLSWIIVKSGNILSHNAIVLREYKIPSIIQYPEYNKLKAGMYIEIKTNSHLEK